MLNNRIIKMFGIAVLITAAVLIVLSGVSLPASIGVSADNAGNSDGLAQYHRSERAAHIANLNGTNMYHQSERNRTYPARSNDRGLAQYLLSERGKLASVQDSLEIYYQSERNLALNMVMFADPLYKYHQSEWYGR